MVEHKRNQGFENLACYQHALKLLSAAYRLAERLPPSERYNMADQLRRAALSALLNLAEGYGRYHFLDKLRFFYYARGSLCETLSIFISAHQIGYLDDEQLRWVRDTETEAEKSLNGYIRFVRKQKQGITEFGHKYVHDENVNYDISPISFEYDEDSS